MDARTRLEMNVAEARARHAALSDEHAVLLSAGLHASAKLVRRRLAQAMGELNRAEAALAHAKHNREEKDMAIQLASPEDIFRWADGTTCYRCEYERGHYQQMSDDFEVIPVGSPGYDAADEPGHDCGEPT